MLFGFRDPAAIRRELVERPELRPLADRLDRLESDTRRPASGAILRAFYEHVMTRPQPEVDALLAPLVARLAPLHRDGTLDRASADFWAARAAAQVAPAGPPFDRGILSIYLLNLVRLAPGEGTFVGPGVLHAYLEGRTVEIMASSDNVIRGGLTPKHVDVAELLRILRFEPGTPRPIAPVRATPCEWRYDTPAREFALGRILPDGPVTIEAAAAGPEALIVLEGHAEVAWPGGTQPLPRGAAVFLPHGLRYTLAAGAGALLFRAFVPQ
jgi:mannose-6-phosphate isomerase